MTAFSRPNEWVHVPTSARGLPRGPIKPMGTVLPIERVRRPLLARLFGRRT